MKLLITLSTLYTSILAVKLNTVYQFPTGTWLENLAPMHNGSLLVTVIGRAEVHIVNPTITPSTSSLLTSFPSVNAILGITQLTPTIYALAAGNVTPSNTPIPGSFAIHTLNFSCPDTLKVAKLVDLKNVDMVNGLTALNSRTLLLADSWAGNVVKLDTQSRTYSVLLEHESLKPNFSAPGLPLGVNGLRVHGKYVYYSNTVQNLLGRVKVDGKTGKQVGEFEVIVQGEEISQPDDFAVRKDGSVVLARPLADTVQRVGLDGKVEVIAKGGLASGATSVVFAKGKDGKKLYLSESGLEEGVVKSGGRVVIVEL